MRILETSDIWDIWLAFLLSWPSASAKGNIYDPPFIGTTNQIPLPPKFQNYATSRNNLCDEGRLEQEGMHQNHIILNSQCALEFYLCSSPKTKAI